MVLIALTTYNESGINTDSWSKLEYFSSLPHESQLERSPIVSYYITPMKHFVCSIVLISFCVPVNAYNFVFRVKEVFLGKDNVQIYIFCGLTQIGTRGNNEKR
jgi:hypothetical protein